MSESFYFLMVVIGTIGTVSAIWWVVREIASNQPEMNGDSNMWFLRLVMLFIPALGQLTGLYYIFFGPTRKRSERRINDWLSSLGPQVIAEQVDEQIKLSSVQMGLIPIQNLRDDPWFKEHWINQNPKERIALIKKNEATLLVNIRKYLSSFWSNGSSSRGVSNWAMALRDTIDIDAGSMTKGTYAGS